MRLLPCARRRGLGGDAPKKVEALLAQGYINNKSCSGLHRLRLFASRPVRWNSVVSLSCACPGAIVEVVLPEISDDPSKSETDKHPDDHSLLW